VTPSPEGGAVTADHPIDELLLLWEDAHQRGESVSAETLCRDRPDLLPEVRRRITALCAVYRVLNVGAPEHPERTGPDDPAPVPFPEVPGYVISAELGHGGMGVVYRARQVSIGREVALKMIRAGHLASPAEVQRFRTEAESVGVLDHPNIVPIYEVGGHERQQYFSMRLLEGGSLADHLDRYRTDPRAGAALVAKVARAVQYAHEHGVLHRDLKPANILLDPAGEPHVSDFGLAKRLEATAGTQSGAVLGTPNYMAPEQAAGQGKRLTTAADVYALGVILYEVLTGRTPFQGEAPLDTLLRVLHDEPVPPSRFRRQVPTDLETICLKCLRKEPSQRYAGAGALADDLARFLAGEPIQARSVGAGERLVKWVRRRPAPAALIGVAIAVGAGLVAGGWWYSYTEHEHALQEAGLRERADDSARAYLIERDAATNQRDAALLNLYVLRINRAQREWEAGNYGPVVDLLDACRPRPGEKDLRGFEWYYLWNLCHAERLALRVRGNRAECVAWGPDGRYLATAGSDGTVQIWDANTGAEVHALNWHAADKFDTWKLVFNRAGTRLASAAINRSRSSEVRVWETATGRVVSTLQIPRGEIKALAFGPDGAELITATRSTDPKLEGAIQVWDAAGQLKRSGSVPSIGILTAAAFTPDGRYLAWESECEPKRAICNLSIWDVTTGQSRVALKAYPNWSNNLGFGPDGRRVIRVRNDDTIEVWDVSADRTGEPSAPLRTVEHPSMIHDVALSADGIHMAFADDLGVVRVCGAKSGDVRRTLKGHRFYLKSLAFDPDGRQLATAGFDGAVKVWDATAGPAGNWASAQWSFPGWGHSSNATFDPDRQRLAACGADRVWVWEIATGLPVLSFAQQYCPAASLDGRWVATQSPEDVTVRELSTGRPVIRIPRPAPKDGFCVLVFNPDGSLLARGTSEPTVEIWGTARDSGEQSAPLFVLKTGTGARPAFSPDGRHLVTTSLDNRTLKLWDVSSARGGTIDAPLLTIKCEVLSAFAVAFSPDGTRLAAAANEPVIYVWDVSTARGELTAPVLKLHGHTTFVTALCWSPDGTRLASGSDDKTVKVWETGTGQELLSLRAHSTAISGLAFFRDGRRLTSTSNIDGAVKVWEADAPTPELLLRRTASRLVRNLYVRLRVKDEVIAHLRRDATLSEPLRREALSCAERYPDRP
jgi:WD40 repeat protein